MFNHDIAFAADRLRLDSDFGQNVANQMLFEGCIDHC